MELPHLLLLCWAELIKHGRPHRRGMLGYLRNEVVHAGEVILSESFHRHASACCFVVTVGIPRERNGWAHNRVDAMIERYLVLDTEGDTIWRIRGAEPDGARTRED